MKKFLFAFALLASAAATTAVHAAAPMLLNYQGRLSAPDGTPKNGSFTMVFSFYDAENGGDTLPSGTPWSESQNVTVTDGVFNVLLGSVTALPATLFEGGPSDSAGPLRFLNVVVDGETLEPRRRVASAAYALSGSGGSSGGGYIQEYSPADLVGGTLQVVHNLGKNYPLLAMWDDQERLMKDLEVIRVSADRVDVVNATSIAATTLLLHFDAGNGTTAFLDSSSAPHTVTALGAAQHSTAQFRLGTASGKFDGATSTLLLPPSSDWQFAGGDFTVDLWARFDGAAPAIAHSLFCHGSNGSNYLDFRRTPTGFSFYVFEGNSPIVAIIAPDTISNDIWYHLAVVRHGQTWRLYRDGAVKGEVTSSVTVPAFTGEFAIGTLYAGINGDSGPMVHFNGWLDEVRVSKGVARWTSNFTPPAIPYHTSWHVSVE